MAKYTNEIILQGFYGKWEDLIYCEDEQDAKQMLKDYNENEPHVSHRIIHRKELNREYAKTLTDIDVIEYRWGKRGAFPLALSFTVPSENRMYNMKGEGGINNVEYYDLNTLTPTNKKYYREEFSDDFVTKTNRKTYKCEGNTLDDVLKCLSKHYNISKEMKGHRTCAPKRKTNNLPRLNVRGMF